MLASEVITQGLELINIPGTGALLSPADQLKGFNSLKRILKERSITNYFVPGINRHFFDLVGGKAIYSYGPGKLTDFRTDDFGGDGVPVRVEKAGNYIREGSSITNNQQLLNHRFESGSLSWGSANSPVFSNDAVSVIGLQTVLQTLSSLTNGVTYTVAIDVLITGGNLQLLVEDSVLASLLSQFLTVSGKYTFNFTMNANSPATLRLVGTAATNATINSVSIIQEGKPMLELPDSQGSDYNVKMIDQRRYNRRFTKGTGGRPYEILFSRNYPNAEIRFDNSGVPRDILVMDVLVAKTTITSISDEIRLHGEADEWLVHELAFRTAGVFGKSLRPSLVKVKDDAWNSLVSANRRTNALGVDRALHDRPTFDINRGDP